MKKLVVMIVVVSAITSGAISYEKAPACRKAEMKLSLLKFGASVGAAKLPKTFDELSLIPIIERKVFFGDLSSEEKYEVLLEQKRFILSHDLSQEKNAYIEKVFSYLTRARIAEFERNAKSGIKQEPIIPVEVQNEAKLLFSSEEGMRYFGTIGVRTVEAQGNALPAKGPSAAEVGGECWCSTTSIFSCSDNWKCTQSVRGCEMTSTGCGYLWMWPCDGDGCNAPMTN